MRAALLRLSAALDRVAVTVALNVTVVGAALAVAAWITAYVPRAYRRVYGGGWPGTAVRIVALHAAYWAAIVAATVALLILVLLGS